MISTPATSHLVPVVPHPGKTWPSPRIKGKRTPPALRLREEQNRVSAGGCERKGGRSGSEARRREQGFEGIVRSRSGRQEAGLPESKEWG